METKTLYIQKPWLEFYPPEVPSTVDINSMSIPEAFDQTVKDIENKTAIVFYGKKITYRELKEQIDKFAAALVTMGLQKGDLFALYLTNSPQFIIAYFAALKAGAAVTPISPLYTSVEVKYQLENSGAKNIICLDILYDNVEKTGVELDNVIITNIGEYLPPLKKMLGKSLLRKLASELEIPTPKILKRKGVHQFQDLIKNNAPISAAVEIDPEQNLATLPYTGGTTGPPKGVMLTHYNLLVNEAMVRSYFPFLGSGEEVVICFMPLYHIYGQVVIMLDSLLQGNMLVVFTTPDFDDILYSIEMYQATIFYGVPTVFEVLKEHEKTDRVSWERFKLIVCAADTLHETTVQEWENRTGTSIIEGYGMSELSPACHMNPAGRPKVTSFGIPIPNVSAAVIDPDTLEFVSPGQTGELIINGPNVMKGYWHKEEETKKSFLDIGDKTWFRTGDLVKMDEEGYFYFYDRSKDLIKYKGYSVFAREIEDVLYNHPQVKAAGVIGVPEPKVGHIIKANVVLQSEARGKISEEEIKEYCKERLAEYKVPKIVEFRGELPKTDVGKVSRRELREELEDE